MTIHYNLHRFGQDQFAVGHLINGDLPTDDEKRWEILDAPRYHIKKLLDEHLRAQAALRSCRDTGQPFVLFLRSFSSEHSGTRTEGFVGSQFSLHSVEFQQRIKLRLEDDKIPLVKLHGGSDGFFSDFGEEAKVLSTHAQNWEMVARELIQAASAIVFLVSHTTAGVVEEFNLIRESNQLERCLVVLLQSSDTADHASADIEGLRGGLADFPHVFELHQGMIVSPKSESESMDATLTKLLHDARTHAPLQQSLDVEFTYLEPGFTESQDFAETETFIWRQLRLLRVMFEDTYWAALKSHGIAFEHFTFPAPWTVAHQVYGLAIATADFRAIRESLSILSLLYIFRGADFALVIRPLAAQYGELAAQIFRAGEPDTEARYASGPDPLELPSKIAVAIQLFRLADKAGRDQDPESAIYLYQAAVICALRATDCDDPERRWIVANMCQAWATFQGASVQVEWAVTNYRFAVTLYRELAAADPDRYASDLALSLNNFGGLHFRRRDFSEAKATFVEALEIRRAAPSESKSYLVDLHTSLANLGLLRVEMGELESARTIYNEALAVCEKRLISDPTALADLTRLQGWMSVCLARIPGAADEAVEYAQRAADTLAKMSDVSPESVAGLREILDQALRARAESQEQSTGAQASRPKST
jgi:tetratricopeptide (TPR) repeat protein